MCAGLTNRIAVISSSVIVAARFAFAQRTDDFEDDSHYGVFSVHADPCKLGDPRPVIAVFRRIAEKTLDVLDVERRDHFDTDIQHLLERWHAPRGTHLSFRCPQMTQEPLQGQDAFLDAARAQATRVAIFLVNGIRLVGSVESFDRHMVLLRSATGVQLVYKHAISTVQPDTGRPRPIRNAYFSSEVSHDKGVEQPVVVARKRRFPTTVDGG
jgi:host factor-I protein